MGRVEIIEVIKLVKDTVVCWIDVEESWLVDENVDVLRIVVVAGTLVVLSVCLVEVNVGVSTRVVVEISVIVEVAWYVVWWGVVSKPEIGVCVVEFVVISGGLVFELSII